MKKSIKRLPKRTQEELAVLQELILKYLSNVRMIILYGSYARGNYVLWEEGWEFGARYTFQSDLDILVICNTTNSSKVEEKARRFVIPRYEERMAGKRHPAPPQIIVENTQTITRALKRKQYFFTEIIQDGILLYDDGKFTLSKAEKPTYRLLKLFSEEEAPECFHMGERFLKHGRTDGKEEEYKFGSFQLHQACERFFKAYLLTHSLIRPKFHLLQVLDAMAKNRSHGFMNVFPTNTPEEKESFDKLCRAYIEARYNRMFTVSKEQYEYMLARTEILRDVTARECAARIAYYEEMTRKEEKGEI